MSLTAAASGFVVFLLCVRYCTSTLTFNALKEGNVGKRGTCESVLRDTYGNKWIRV